MGQAQRVIIPYAPRKAFLPFHGTEKRFSCMVAHRRAGKTVAHINRLIRSALTCRRKEPRCAYIAPYFNQAKDAAWSYLKEYGLTVPGAEAHETELRVDFPNGGRVRLYGADNPDRLRGVYFDDVVLDEYADMDPRMWTQVVRPALSDRIGSAAFIGTPKGKNDFWRIYSEALADPEWFTAVLRASETGLLAQNELDAARKVLSDDEYAQEYECSFDAGIVGAYYAKEMQAAESQGRICGVPYQPGAAVWTAWDLGIDDMTAIWFVQMAGREVHVLDYVEGSGVGLDFYVRQVRERPYVYGGHLLPHDAEVKELGTGRSRVETLGSLGLREVTVVPRQEVSDGVNAARLLLPRCWFDKEKTARGVEALRQYRREWDEKTKTFRMRPRHDWTSHAADAFRYLALGLRDRGGEAIGTPAEVLGGGPSFNVGWMAA